MSNRPNRRPTGARGAGQQPEGRTRVLLIAGALGLLVVVIGLVVALAGGSDDSTGTDDTTPAYGPAISEDDPLPAFTSTDGDAAAGLAAPIVEGISPEGDPVTIGGAGEPTLVTFLAHWCPHCQRELPVLVELQSGGELDGIRTVAVLTGTDANRPNFPPVAWLDREGWAGEVLLDDEAQTAARAYGLSSYPFLVLLDGDGKVVARAEGEVPAADIVALADLAR
jgi:thiol-disulfide isomerase/thioredoxin